MCGDVVLDLGVTSDLPHSFGTLCTRICLLVKSSCSVRRAGCFLLDFGKVLGEVSIFLNLLSISAEVFIEDTSTVILFLWMFSDDGGMF